MGSLNSLLMYQMLTISAEKYFFSFLKNLCRSRFVNFTEFRSFVSLQKWSHDLIDAYKLSWQVVRRVVQSLSGSYPSCSRYRIALRYLCLARQWSSSLNLAFPHSFIIDAASSTLAA